MERARVIVSVDVSKGAVSDDMLTALTAAGLAVDVSMEAMGVVIGEARTADLETIRRVPGVLAVEPDRTVSLPKDPRDPQ